VGITVAVPYVCSDLATRHDPAGEVWIGLRTPGTELGERAELIRSALREAGGSEVAAERHPDQRALALHDPALARYLREAWERWTEAGLDRDPGQGRVVPYLFPHPELLAGLPLREPRSAAARAGRFSYDTMTLIGPGTWEAARGALDAALTAADLVVGGEPLAYALCRPPGHHATRGAIGGSCYLNNAAAAAHALAEGLGAPVAVLDIDAHHGNGTAAIFCEEPAVLTGSAHVDPAAGWFPHYAGFAEETGSAAGAGTNLNLPLPPGTGDRRWLAAVEHLAGWARRSGARALVVALGVDAVAGDPESPFEVSAGALVEAGSLLGGLGLPTVAVQEGGYRLETLGELVATTLDALARANASALARAS
jgi:acetoin utilization deacetylase AcuC-like enzyme